MTVLKPMLKLALLPLLLLLILVQWAGIFLTTFSTILTNLLAGLFFFVALASWVMQLADGGEVLKITFDELHQKICDLISVFKEDTPRPDDPLMDEFSIIDEDYPF